MFNVTNMTRKEPSVTVKVPRGKTNYELLDVAKLQNPCYAATYRKTSWGWSVMSICGVAKQPMLGYYWLTRVNGRKPHYGRDGKFRPKELPVCRCFNLTFILRTITATLRLKRKTTLCLFTVPVRKRLSFGTYTLFETLAMYSGKM